jgi:hypothetical protein
MGSMRVLRGLGVAVAAVCLLALVLAGPASAAERAPHRTAKPSLSLKVVVAGNRQILATGAAHPVPARGRVVLQLRRDGAWHRLGRTPLTGHGAYWVRAVVPAGIDEARLRAALYEGKRQRAVSPARSLRLEQPTSPSTPTGPGVPSTTSSPPAVSPPGVSETPGAAEPPGHSEPPVTEPPTEPPVVTEPPCTPAATSAGSPPAAPAGPLSAESLMATIEKYASHPNHLSGTAESAAAESEFTGALADAGLKVCEQAFTFPRFTPTAVGLSVEGTALPAAAIAPLLYSGATGPAGTTAPLVYIGEPKTKKPSPSPKPRSKARSSSPRSRTRRTRKRSASTRRSKPRSKTTRRASSPSPRRSATSRSGKTPTRATGPGRCRCCRSARPPAKQSSPPPKPVKPRR